MNGQGATHREIAGAVGVSQPTVSRDLIRDESEPASDTSSDLQEQDLQDPLPNTDESGPEEAEPEPVKTKPAPVMLTLYTHENDPVEYPQPRLGTRNILGREILRLRTHSDLRPQ